MEMATSQAEVDELMMIIKEMNEEQEEQENKAKALLSTGGLIKGQQYSTRARHRKRCGLA
jgi:hypothetical protein